MNLLIYVFFVHQYHKPFDIRFLLIYPKRVFHTSQSDKLLRVYWHLYTLFSVYDTVQKRRKGFIMRCKIINLYFFQCRELNKKNKDLSNKIENLKEALSKERKERKKMDETYICKLPPCFIDLID